MVEVVLVTGVLKEVAMETGELTWIGPELILSWHLLLWSSRKKEWCKDSLLQILIIIILLIFLLVYYYCVIVLLLFKLNCEIW